MDADEQKIKEIIEQFGEERRETAEYSRFIEIRDRSKRIGKKYERKKSSL